MIVRPCLASLRKISTILSDIKESNPLVGSSQKRMAGLVRISEAKESLFRWPPEMPCPGFPMMESAHFVRPN